MEKLNGWTRKLNNSYGSFAITTKTIHHTLPWNIPRGNSRDITNIPWVYPEYPTERISPQYPPVDLDWRMTHWLSWPHDGRTSSDMLIEILQVVLLRLSIQLGVPSASSPYSSINFLSLRISLLSKNKPISATSSAIVQNALSTLKFEPADEALTGLGKFFSLTWNMSFFMPWYT